MGAILTLFRKGRGHGVAGVIAFVLLYCLAVFPGCGKKGSDVQAPRPLLVYCAAGMSKPMEAISHQYEEESHQKVELQIGGSGTLLSSIVVSKRGDLFVAADESYITQAKQEGIVGETATISVQQPVLITVRGNPKNIHELKDLLRADVHASLANPTAASIGKITQQMAEKEGIWTELEKAVQQRGVLKPTVNDVANDVKLGVMDVGIVWDNVAGQYPDVATVEMTGSDKWLQHVVATTLVYSLQPERAKAFLAWLTAPTHGQAILAQFKFRPAVQ